MCIKFDKEPSKNLRSLNKAGREETKEFPFVSSVAGSVSWKKGVQIELVLIQQLSRKEYSLLLGHHVCRDIDRNEEAIK